ncbi:MAG: replication initiator, partial [Dermatophilaceae bacterium]
DAAALANAVRDALTAVELSVPGVDDEDVSRLLRWGSQVDVRTVRAGQRTDDPAGPLTPGQVAGYLAKYATKDAGHLTDPEARQAHVVEMQRVCRDLADRAYEADGIASPYALLGKWVHMLGFRGHFSTKSRRYSITLGALRRARARWQAMVSVSRRTGVPLDVDDVEAWLLADEQDETTLVVGQWTYLGTGWQTAGDEALALAAAARAREYAQHRAAAKRIAKQGDLKGEGHG